MKQSISIIVPVFNERHHIISLVDDIKQVMEGYGDYEVIFVDDGSSDGTYELIAEQSAADERVVGIRFRRNYGQTAAIKAGLDAARGDICITMDGDMQHDPALIPLFLDKMSEGYDLVCGYRQGRKDPFLRRFPSKIANMLARIFSRQKLRDFGSTFRAYRTSLAREMPIYGEMHRFIPVFIGMQTDRITEIPIVVKPRQQGQSKYGISRTFRVISDLLVLLFFSRFFNRPIHIFGYIAVILGLPGFLILAWLSMAKLFGSIAIGDYGPLFIFGVLLVLVSVQLFTTGIVCEYLVRVYYNRGAQKPYNVDKTTRDQA